MKKNSLKIVAAFLAVATLASCTGDTPGESDLTSTEPETTRPITLSNPVKLDENGDIDMEVALSYETDFDKFLADLDGKTIDGTVSDNTNEETKALYEYLKKCYDEGLVLSGQQVSGKKQQEDILYYYLTEDLPAIKGFDFIFKTTPSGDGADWTQMAIDWHTKSGGIVAFCWHWNVPVDVNEPDSNAHAFYSEDIKNFSLKNAVTPGTKEYEVVIHDIDLIAYELQRLESAGVPVLWRPLHEASGSWFWWGVADKEAVLNQYYQKLWYMIYDRLENYHKLTNLIWVWNGQSKKAEVHANTYDISGIDIYPNSEDHSAQESKYKTLESITADDRIIALTECGYIPDPDELLKSETAKWLYFMPWNGEFVYKGSSVLGIPRINTEKMSEEFLIKTYKAENIITWKELPKFEGTENNLPDMLQLMLPDMEKQKEKDAEKK